MDGCRKLSEVFYGFVAKDPVLRPIFRGSFHCAIPSLALYLAQLLGGPCEYSAQRWWLSLREAHLRFRIGEKERKAWLKHMRRALREIEIDPAAASALYEFFEETSVGMVNHPKVRTSADDLGPAAGDGPFQQEVCGFFNAQNAIEKAVAAVRAGEADRAIQLGDSSVLEAYFARNPADLASLLAVMIASGNHTLSDYVQRRLKERQELVQQQYSRGRTLLHDAAAAGNVVMTTLLLQLGANPNGENGHPPLYCVGNECRTATGGAVVRILVRASADVNAQDGVKQCTALHMAARRGNVPVAEALIDCGANIEARDSSGDSPLRRAINCKKPEVAALLLARGADPDAIGSKGLTPRRAARSGPLKELFG